MKEGWTWADLAGELWARGIDPDEVSSRELDRALDDPTPELAAERLAKEGW